MFELKLVVYHVAVIQKEHTETYYECTLEIVFKQTSSEIIEKVVENYLRTLRRTVTEIKIEAIKWECIFCMFAAAGMFGVLSLQRTY